MSVIREAVDKIREIMSTTLNQWRLKWNLRVLILISLFMQIVLLLVAPMRKRTVRAYVVVPVWLAYTFADPIAYFALGLISKTHVTAPSPGSTIAPSPGPTSATSWSSSSTNDPPELVAFWASLFLVFLGRPITATAFALEDNELWLRHLLGLGFPCWVVCYTLFVLRRTNVIWLPTCLMFVVGLIKYLQRTRSLYLASSRRLKKSFLHQIDSNGTDVGNLDDLADIDVISTFFKSFKILIADMKLSVCMRSKSRGFFLRRTSTDAFNLVEEELKLFYGILYTKARVMHAQGIGNYLTSFVVGFMLLYAVQQLKSIDRVITLTVLLVISAQEEIITINIPRLFRALARSNKVSILLSAVGMTRPEGSGGARGTIAVPIIRNWSQSMSQFNLIQYCLHPRLEAMEMIIRKFDFNEVLDNWKYVETAKFTSDFRKLIFNELKEKSEIAESIEIAKDIMYPARGDWVLGKEGCINLLPWINLVSFDESIILWHIATELCFQGQGQTQGGARGGCGPRNSTSSTVHTAEKQLPTHSYRDMSKNLSDYLIYLLILHPTIMSDLEGKGKMRFRRTCEEVKEIFQDNNIGEKGKHCLNIFCCSFGKCRCKGKTREDTIQKEACEHIQNIRANSERGFAKGDGITSVLSNACELVIELNKLEEERKWKIISRVWVEMLCYSACRCRGMVHAAQLSKGGQLITVVWSLMAKLGLGDHFEGD